MRVAWEPTLERWPGRTSGRRSLERPNWAPIILSGAIPREVSDFLAITILEVLSIQLAFSGPIPFAGVGSSWILVSLVPLTCILCALSNSPNREREELALVAYGGSSRQIELRYIMRGAIITATGLLPILLRLLAVDLNLSIGLIMVILLVLVGGVTYSVPALHRTRSADFVEHYKG
jgi:hypothetical protein